MSNSPDMEGFILFTPPVPAPDLEEVHTILRGANVFVPSFDADEADPYHVMTYVEQQVQFETEFVILPDRNVLTRWVGLLRGVAAEEKHRVSAGIMALAICADILIEPNIALYELANSSGNQAAIEELHLFRIAEEVEPQYWVNVALGRSLYLLPAGAKYPNKPAPPSVDLQAPLYRWQRNYILALKIAELHLRGGRSETRMAELLRWMYYEFLIGGPAILLASHYLAPNSDRGGLFKGIESGDREKAIAGIRNAAWDLTLLSEWLRRIQIQNEQQDDKPVTILCSLDEHVSKFARSLVNYSAPVEWGNDGYLNRMFGRIWGPEAGARLASVLAGYQDSADNAERQLHRESHPDFITKLIETGEATIREWKPKQKRG